jgi:hypothetical protein
LTSVRLGASLLTKAGSIFMTGSNRRVTSQLSCRSVCLHPRSDQSDRHRTQNHIRCRRGPVTRNGLTAIVVSNY